MQQAFLSMREVGCDGPNVGLHVQCIRGSKGVQYGLMITSKRRGDVPYMIPGYLHNPKFIPSVYHSLG